MARIISVITHKGGTLKTSLVTNIAGVLSQDKSNKEFILNLANTLSRSGKSTKKKGKKILIVDMDGQGNAGMSFGFKPDKDFETNIYDVLLEGENIQNTITKAHKNIDIVGANTDMISFELDVLAIKKVPSNRYFNLLKTAIEPIKEDYDYILIDTPPSLGLIAGNVLSATNDVIIPFHPEPYSQQSLITILKQIREFRNALNKEINILGVVGTIVDSRTTLHSELLQECRQFVEGIGVKMFDTVIPKSIRFANSVAYNGKPATLTDKNNKLVSSYFELVKEMDL